MRHNKLIWKIAEHLHDAFFTHYSHNWESQIEEAIEERNSYYDEALELYTKIINNEFTGKDNHAD